MPMKLDPNEYGVATLDELGRLVGTTMGEAGNQGLLGKARVIDNAANRANNAEFDRAYNNKAWRQSPNGPVYTGVVAQVLGRDPDRNGRSTLGQYSMWDNPTSSPYKMGERAYQDIVRMGQDPSYYDSLSPQRQGEINESLAAVRGVLGGDASLRGLTGGSLFYSTGNISKGQRAMHENLGLAAAEQAGKADGHYFYGATRGADRALNERETRLMMQRAQGFDATGGVAKLRAERPDLFTNARVAQGDPDPTGQYRSLNVDALIGAPLQNKDETNRFVTETFRNLYGRDPQGAELNSWSRSIEQGLQPQDMYAALKGTREYQGEMPKWDAEKYLQDRTDVRDSGMDPAYHWQKFGRFEPGSTTQFDPASVPRFTDYWGGSQDAGYQAWLRGDRTGQQNFDERWGNAPPAAYDKNFLERWNNAPPSSDEQILGGEGDDVLRGSGGRKWDPEAYLLANPDVRDAGIDPAYHISRFGGTDSQDRLSGWDLSSIPRFMEGWGGAQPAGYQQWITGQNFDERYNNAPPSSPTAQNFNDRYNNAPPSSPTAQNFNDRYNNAPPSTGWNFGGGNVSFGNYPGYGFPNQTANNSFDPFGSQSIYSYNPFPKLGPNDLGNNQQWAGPPVQPGYSGDQFDTGLGAGSGSGGQPLPGWNGDSLGTGLGASGGPTWDSGATQRQQMESLRTMQQQAAQVSQLANTNYNAGFNPLPIGYGNLPNGGGVTPFTSGIIPGGGGRWAG